MPSIKVLPDNLINKIAAGEVVERPASVVKELIENAIDAGASEVFVDVEQAGKRLIRVTDDGCGIAREDVRTAFARHATSKLSSEADLEAIGTMGFRGEALSSIASVSRVRMLTAQRGAASGTLVEIENGQVRTVEDAASAPGTQIEVNHLFYNTPARLKFLKSDATELSHIIAAVSRQALSRPGIRFRLTHQGKPLLDLPGSADIRERIFQLHGADLSEELMPFSAERTPARVRGFVGKPGRDRADRSLQEFYVNGRFVRNASLAHAVADAYRDLAAHGRYPAAFVFLDIDPALVDVNVHPAKTEVRFRNQAQVHDLVRDAIREAVRGQLAPGPYGADAGRAERIQEAIADFGSRMASNTECGVRSTEWKTKNAVSTGSLEPHSELGTPHSALLQPLAQVHDSFIVAQDNDGMVLIDQHAAHERVLFEKLQDLYTLGSLPVQNLLLPVQVEPGPADGELLREHLPELAKLGFAVEEFGGGTFLVKAVPSLLAGGDHRRLLEDVVAELREHGRSGTFDELRDELLSVMACHPAIKVHRRLGTAEREGLIRDLFACRMPHSCPHGRPTMVRFTMDDIRKLFKRI